MTEKLTIEQLQELALANGIAILDWMDARILQCRCPEMRKEDAPKVIAQLANMLGDWDDCVGREQSAAVIREAAEVAGVNLYANETE